MQGCRGAERAGGSGSRVASRVRASKREVRKNLHLILCHSPVGSAFRIRGREFPALISCMSLDVFHPWPRDALNGVAQRFLQELKSTGNIEDEETARFRISSHGVSECSMLKLTARL